jgi:hypothetical protein
MIAIKPVSLFASSPVTERPIRDILFRTRRSALTGLCLALVSVGAFASLAMALPRPLVIVRDGVYAGQWPHNTSVHFYVRGRRIYHLRFVITVSCGDASGRQFKTCEIEQAQARRRADSPLLRRSPIGVVRSTC